MFSVNSKDVESQLKVTYKTNLQNSEGKDVTSLIQNSFFQNNSELKKIEAIKNQSLLKPKYERLQDIECHFDVPNHIQGYYQRYK